jgi:hypothetical protein
LSGGAISDTRAEALRVLIELYARMTPGEKLARVRELTGASSLLALSGLRARFPDETQPELLLRLARIWLGDEMTRAAYGGATGDGS